MADRNEGELLPFDDEKLDLWIVEEVKQWTRELVRNPKLKPAEMVGLARAIHALDRLPNATRGIHVEYAVSLRGGDDELSEMRCWQVCITSSSFSMDSGGSVYDSAVGGDSFTDMSFHWEARGISIIDGDFNQWIDEARGALGLDPNIEVDDNSEPDCMER